MSKCQWADECPFFSDKVGYSTELHERMRAEYCYGDATGCARLLAWTLMPDQDVPDDLIPADVERVSELKSRLP